MLYAQLSTLCTQYEPVCVSVFVGESHILTCNVLVTVPASTTPMYIEFP